MIEGLMTYDEACEIRANEDFERRNNPDYKRSALMPQSGFQERVLRCNADILFIGGNRGGGKTFVINMLPLYNVESQYFGGVIIRKEISDLKRTGGPWDTSSLIFNDIGTQTMTDRTWTFKWGSKMTYEHISDEAKTDQRFRGQQIPYIGVDEIDQFMESTFWMLLSSNRNSSGIKNQIVGTCNPNSKSWVHR